MGEDVGFECVGGCFKARDDGATEQWFEVRGGWMERDGVDGT